MRAKRKASEFVERERDIFYPPTGLSGYRMLKKSWMSFAVCKIHSILIETLVGMFWSWCFFKCSDSHLFSGNSETIPISPNPKYSIDCLFISTRFKQKRINFELDS